MATGVLYRTLPLMAIAPGSADPGGGQRAPLLKPLRGGGVILCGPHSVQGAHGRALAGRRRSSSASPVCGTPAAPQGVRTGAADQERGGHQRAGVVDGGRLRRGGGTAQATNRTPPPKEWAHRRVCVEHVGGGGGKPQSQARREPAAPHEHGVMERTNTQMERRQLRVAVRHQA